MMNLSIIGSGNVGKHFTAGAGCGREVRVREVQAQLGGRVQQTLPGGLCCGHGAAAGGGRGVAQGGDRGGDP